MGKKLFLVLTKSRNYIFPLFVSIIITSSFLGSHQSYAGVDPLTFICSSGSLAASAKFEQVGPNIVVTLTNTSPSDVLVPVDVLTGVFFDIDGVALLVPTSALLGTSVVFFGPDGGGNVGGEWAYASGLAGPNGATEGISSAGLGLFGGSNFGGANLQGPAAVNGLQYGITSAGDNTATGNAPVTGGNALIKNQVVFTLAGTGLTSVSNVSFQYGTALDEPNVFCRPPVPPTELVGGELLSIDNTVLLLAGIQLNLGWIAPVVLAGAGLAAYKLRRN